MFSLFGKDKDKTKSEPSLLDRLKRSVERTRSQIAARVEELVTGEKRVDAGALKQLENSLLAADLGVRTTRDLVEAVRLESERAPLRSADAIKRVLKAQLMAILQAAPAANAAPQGAAGQAAAPYSAVGAAAHPEVVFIVGVNGTGKDHNDRQAGAPLQSRAAAKRAALRGRYLSRRRNRATGRLGDQRTGAEMSFGLEIRRRSERRSCFDALYRPQAPAT
jgi:hypothetical protein